MTPLLAFGDEVGPEKDEVCRIDDTTTVHRAEANHTPNYFFRPFPSSDEVSYASARRNYILDLKSGAEVEIPGPYDPVPTPDQLIMTTPPDEGLSFYSVGDLKKGRKEPLFVDESLKGVYQSIGTVAEGEGEKTFRVITDQDGLSFRDYTIREGKGGERPKVNPQGPVRRLCAGMRLSLPMLSKDGRQIAALDVDAGVTKIYDIDPASGSCTESMNLGFPTGKVDFHFDNDQITFHVLNNDEGGDSYFSVPSDSLVANVYVMKRSTGEITRLTNNTNSNSVFPAFRKDGKVVYLNHPQRSGAPGAKSTFVVADPEKANRLPVGMVTGSPACGADGRKGFHAVAALGALWAQLCSRYGNEISDSAAALMTLSLDPKRCRKLVETRWSRLRDDILKNAQLTKSGRVKADILEDLREEDLLAACPTKSFTPVSPPTGTGGEPGDEPALAAPVPGLCFECHSDDIPFNDWERLTTEKAESGRPWRDEILDRMSRTGRGRMPPRGHTLSTAEKAAFEKYLRTGAP